MHRKSNARIANATKTKEKMGQNVITTVICPITNSIPLIGKSKSRQCFVKILLEKNDLNVGFKDINDLVI